MKQKEMVQIELVTPTPNRNVLGQILDWWYYFTKDPDDFVSYNEKDNKKVKELFIRLWRGFPAVTFSEEMIKDTFKRSEIVEELLKEKYLLSFPTFYPNENKTKFQFSIGPNGIQLVQSWQMEKLTHVSLMVSIVASVAAIISLVVTATQSPQNFAAVIVTYLIIFLLSAIILLFSLPKIKKLI